MFKDLHLHQLVPEALPWGVLAYQRLELSNQASMPTDGNVRVDPVGHRCQACLLKSRDLALRKRASPPSEASSPSSRARYVGSDLGSSRAFGKVKVASIARAVWPARAPVGCRMG